MKLLMFLSPSFSWRPHQRALEHAVASELEETVGDCAVIFVHAESHDPETSGRLLTKFMKNVKWIAGKGSTMKVVLHSFSHLSDSKAPAEFAGTFLHAAAERLEAAGFRVWVTPFGYSCAWNLSVDGESIAKVFKSL